MRLSPNQLNEILGGQLRSSGDALPQPNACCRVVTDSRKVARGDVFWALPGPERHGSDYAVDAYSRGAAGVVADREIAAPAERWSLQVADALAALWKLAAWHRDQFHGTVTAITGSVGKTTTRELIHTVLGHALPGTASPANYNNRVGLPLAMLTMHESHRYAALELGASARGEIRQLAALCRPRIGVITNIGQAHLDTFGDQASIAEAKTELLSELGPAGWAVLNGDDPWLRKLAARCTTPVLWVGRGGLCDVMAERVQCDDDGLRFRVGRQQFSVPVHGRHHLTSVLSAIAVGKLHGLGLDEMAEALRAFESVPLRCQVNTHDGILWIDDCYNSSPSAMRAALELLRETGTSGRQIVVCGDMRELGATSGALHHRLGHDVVRLCGPDLLFVYGNYHHEVARGATEAGMDVRRVVACQDMNELQSRLQRTLRAGDAVLIKGSRALGMEQVRTSVCGMHQRFAA